MAHLYLGVALVAEICGTTFLKLWEEFSRPLPSIVTAPYAVAVYFLSLTPRTIPTGVACTIWLG